MLNRLSIGKALLAVAVFASAASAAGYSMELKPEATKVEFTLGDVLHTVHGTFHLKGGTINFDADTGKASGQVAVDLASGNSGSDARDSRMHANVLESKKYPDAVFVPDHVEGSLALPGTSSLKLHGMFTIHGGTHEITMDVQATTTADQIHATIEFDIPYVAWGMKDPSNFLLKVNKTVRIAIDSTTPLRKQ